MRWFSRWYSVDDHEIDRKTGRPRTAQSWGREKLEIWQNGLLAIGLIFFCAMGWHAGMLDRWLLLVGTAAPLLLLSSFLRMRDLSRKKAALREAIAAYDIGLVRAFAELENELHVDAELELASYYSPHDSPETS